MPITLTERAITEVRDLLTQQGKTEAALRVWVAGGGCSGLQYGMAIDDEAPEEGDLVFDCSGVKLMVDPLSLGYMDGAEVDYVDDMMGGGFKIENPMASGGCGCGNSFKTEGGEEVAESAGGCGSCGCSTK